VNSVAQAGPVLTLKMIFELLPLHRMISTILFSIIFVKFYSNRAITMFATYHKDPGLALTHYRYNGKGYIKPLIIIRLNYYLTSPLTTMAKARRKSQSFLCRSVGEPFGWSDGSNVNHQNYNPRKKGVQCSTENCSLRYSFN
jgi:hypothetical protein